MKYPDGRGDPRATVEGVTWPFTRREVGRMAAFEAKRAGGIGTKEHGRLGIDWVSFEGRRFEYKPAEPGEHYELIVAALRAKLEQNPEVERVLGNRRPRAAAGPQVSRQRARGLAVLRDLDGARGELLTMG